MAFLDAGEEEFPLTPFGGVGVAFGLELGAAELDTSSGVTN